MMGRLDFGHLLLRQRRTFSDDCCAGAGRLNFRPPDIVLTGRSTLLGQGATMDGGGLRRGRDCILGQEGEAQPPHARLDGRSINYSTSPSQSINGDNRLLVAMSGVPNLKGAFPPDLENGGNFRIFKTRIRRYFCPKLASRCVRQPHSAFPGAFGGFRRFRFAHGLGSSHLRKTSGVQRRGSSGRVRTEPTAAKRAPMRNARRYGDEDGRSPPFRVLPLEAEFEF